MAKSGGQVRSGKAFEYALAKEYYEYVLSCGRAVEIVTDNKFNVARGYYEACADGERELYDLSARASIDTIVKLEPGILAQANERDVLQIRLAGDSEGIEGNPPVLFTQYIFQE